jgi:hypothetical protein
MLVDYFPLNNNGGRRNGLSIGIPITEILFHVCQWTLIIEEISEVYRLFSVKNTTIFCLSLV